MKCVTATLRATKRCGNWFHLKCHRIENFFRFAIASSHSPHVFRFSKYVQSGHVWSEGRNLTHRIDVHAWHRLPTYRSRLYIYIYMYIYTHVCAARSFARLPEMFLVRVPPTRVQSYFFRKCIGNTHVCAPRSQGFAQCLCLTATHSSSDRPKCYNHIHMCICDAWIS